jgi:lysophospholipase L1-like esterase
MDGMPDGPIRVFVSGDSTVVTRSLSFLPMVGWGQVLHLFLADDVEVVNCARARASSKSFADRGRLQWIAENARPGDYHLISFGQCDWMPEDGIHAEPFGEFQDYLRRFVQDTRDAGAHPVLVVPQERRRIDQHGNVRRFLGDYPLATLEVAREESVALVDLYGQTIAWWEELGFEGTRRVFRHLKPGEPMLPQMKERDETHLRAEGAIECARFVARALRDQRVLPADRIRDLDRRRFSTDEIGWLDDETFAERTRQRVSRRTEEKVA